MPAKCRIPECVSLAVEWHQGRKSDKCAVHASAQEGPHSKPCSICRKKIERGQFWVSVVKDRVPNPAHPSCVAHPPVKLAKKKDRREGWDNGLGLSV